MNTSLSNPSTRHCLSVDSPVCFKSTRTFSTAVYAMQEPYEASSNRHIAVITLCRSS